MNRDDDDYESTEVATSGPVDGLAAENFDAEMLELQKIVDSSSSNAAIISDEVLPELLRKVKTITNLKQLEVINGMIMSLTSLHTASRGAIDSKLKIKHLRFNQAVKLKPANTDDSSISSQDLKAILDKIGYSSQITINNNFSAQQPKPAIEAEFDRVFDDLVESGEVKQLEIPEAVEIRK